MGFVDAVGDPPAGSACRYRAGRAPARHLRQRAAADRTRETMSQAAQYYRDQLKASPKAIDYLKQRGLTGGIAARFGMGTCAADRPARVAARLQRPATGRRGPAQGRRRRLATTISAIG